MFGVPVIIGYWWLACLPWLLQQLDEYNTDLNQNKCIQEHQGVLGCCASWSLSWFAVAWNPQQVHMRRFRVQLCSIARELLFWASLEYDVHVQQRCQSDTHPMKPRLSFAQGPAPKCPRTGARHRGPVRRSSFPVDGRGDDVARGFSSVVLHPKTSLPRLSADRNGKSAIGHVTGCCPMLPVLVMST